MKLIALAILGFAISAFAQTEVVTTAAQTSKPTSSPKKKTDDDQQKSFRDRNRKTKVRSQPKFMRMKHLSIRVRTLVFLPDT